MPMSKMKKMMEEKGERLWQGLPDDILQLIAQRLYISDYQVLRQVCPNWRAAVNKGIATGSWPCAPQLPWLLLLNSHGLARYLEIHTFDIKHERSSGPEYIRSKIPSPFNPPYCLGTVESWLIVAACQDNDNCFEATVKIFFINPVSHARVMLPSQCTIPQLGAYLKTSNKFLTKIVASSPPASPTRLQQKEHNCLVAALGEVGQSLAICRPSDTSWTPIETKERYIFEDIEIIDQKLYVAGLTNDCKYSVLLEFDILFEDANVDSRAKINYRHCIVPYSSDLNWNQYPRLAKDAASKELFIILSRSWIREGFRVSKMEDKTDGEPSCKEVTDLGDRTLFLSNKSNKVVINDETLGKNCIYCAYNLEAGYGVHSLADRSIKQVYFPSGYSSAKRRQSMWFTPHPW